MRHNPNIYMGLSSNEVKTRIEKNLVNKDTEIKAMSIGMIVTKNIFTYFNLLNLSIAFCIFYVHSYKNLLFMGIVICNTIISIIQEINAKITIDKLNVIASKKVLVIRDSKEQLIDLDNIVLDDIIKLKIGNQIVADSIIKEGTVEVDESFITGESNHILKNAGDMLYSGSFIVSGNCIAKVEHVGDDNYTTKISKEAKHIKKTSSVMLKTLNTIIKIISFVIIPLAIILFLRQYYSSKDLADAIVNTAAAIISMIPEGLVLLTSTVFMVSAMRLARKKVLVHDLYCIESLARVDTICLDKTGTLTLGDVELLKTIKVDDYSVEEILCSIANILKGDNKTMDAIYDKYNKETNFIKKQVVPFSSSRKYSGVSFEDKGTFIIGAKEVLCDNLYNDKFNKYNNYRTLALMYSDDDFNGYDLPKNLKLIGILIFQDRIRKNAKETLDYFKDEGVDVKIITGDSLSSTASILDRLNIKFNGIDMNTVKDTDNLKEIVNKHNVFCRVKPDEKKDLVLALKSQGHTVAFVGDGVNDVLALKEADSSIAVASGAEAARNVSELVLLNSDFSSIPSIVKEGRRTINNIERSGCLFLTKTTYSTLLAIVFLFISMSYPFQPIQLSLTSSLTIGIPSFILALEPNNKKVTGNFLIKIIQRSIPSAITIIIDILVVMLLSHVFKFNESHTSTMAVMLVAFTGFILLFKLCYPFNKLRLFLYVFLVLSFIFSVIGLHNLFDFVLLKPFMLMFMIFLCLLDICIFTELSYFFDKQIDKYEEKIIKVTK